jgi:hypothetical protein
MAERTEQIVNELVRSLLRAQAPQQRSKVLAQLAAAIPALRVGEPPQGVAAQVLELHQIQELMSTDALEAADRIARLSAVATYDTLALLNELQLHALGNRYIRWGVLSAAWHLVPAYPQQVLALLLPLMNHMVTEQATDEQGHYLLNKVLIHLLETNFQPIGASTSTPIDKVNVKEMTFDQFFHAIGRFQMWPVMTALVALLAMAFAAGQYTQRWF